MLQETQRNTATIRLEAVGNAQICIVAGEVGVAEMRQVADHYRDLARRYEDGVVGFSLLRRGTPVAGPKALTEARTFLTDLRESIETVAVVIEDQGVAAQMLASVVRGLNVFSRRKRLTVVTTVEDAIAELAPHLRDTGGSDPAADLRRAIAAATIG